MKYVNSKGHIYEGYVENGKYNGIGKLTVNNGSTQKVYKGYWKDGVLTGFVKITKGDGYTYEIPLNDGKIDTNNSIVYKPGSKYTYKYDIDETGNEIRSLKRKLKYILTNEKLLDVDTMYNIPHTDTTANKKQKQKKVSISDKTDFKESNIQLDKCINDSGLVSFPCYTPMGIAYDVEDLKRDIELLKTSNCKKENGKIVNFPCKRNYAIFNNNDEYEEYQKLRKDRNNI